MNKTIYIETYGCAANQNNSEILAGLLTQAGHIVTNNEELANIIIINSCIVKGKTENKIKRRIQDLKQFAKNKLLIIGGCMPETDAKQLKKLNSNIILLGTHNFKEIINLLNKKQNIIENKSEIKLNLPKVPQNKLISINQISEGCLGCCTYCKTKLAKGQLYSYPQEEILKSIESDLKQGVKEVWITSQDNGAYGLDSKKEDLAKLITNITKLKHRFKLRNGMSNPNHIIPILNNLIESYRSDKVFKFLHIPIQSASNKVLKDMNRKYTIKQAEEIITKFKKQFPDIVIATDIIVGYPTETEKDHKANLDFINKHKPPVLNLSKFSKHKGTKAEKLKELPIKIINKRTTELMKAHRETAKQEKEKFIDKTIKILVDKKIGDHLHQARDKNYNKILIKCDKDKLGKTIDAKIKDIGVHHLVAEII